VFYCWISARLLILPLRVVPTLSVVHLWGLSWGCWWWHDGGGSGCLAQSCAPHVIHTHHRCTYVEG